MCHLIYVKINAQQEETILKIFKQILNATSVYFVLINTFNEVIIW